MSIQPIRDFIAVSKQEAASRTASGLFIPTGEDKALIGVVLAVGSGRVALNGTSIPLEVKVGDTVKFNKSMSVEVTHNGETALLLREEAVLCVLT